MCRQVVHIVKIRSVHRHLLDVLRVTVDFGTTVKRIIHVPYVLWTKMDFSVTGGGLK